MTRHDDKSVAHDEHAQHAAAHDSHPINPGTHAGKPAPPPARHGGHTGKHRPYLALLVSLAVSYAAMYLIMFAMADRWSHVYFNLSNVYMAGLMAGSMLPIMLATMPGMFKNKRASVGLWVASVAILGLFWMLLRTEAGVGDRQFLRAMIPHRSAAIQMVKESSITDPRVRRLADQIIEAQEREIAEMQALLKERN
ncbi:MAG: DUF305 domain-containing protein [Phycisphaerales bacterium]|nr:DUF305 domain-containing protein [Phycisphaerales bacterium]